MAQDPAGFVQNLPKRQRNESQVRGESFALRLRECSQQVISVEIVGTGHGDCHRGLQGCEIQSQSIVQSPSPHYLVVTSPWRFDAPSRALNSGADWRAPRLVTWEDDGGTSGGTARTQETAMDWNFVEWRHGRGSRAADQELRSAQPHPRPVSFR